MIKIGILGDIGSGKSYVAQNFGYPVFNADSEVAKLYKKDKVKELLNLKKPLYTRKIDRDSEFDRQFKYPYIPIYSQLWNL